MTLPDKSTESTPRFKLEEYHEIRDRIQEGSMPVDASKLISEGDLDVTDKGNFRRVEIDATESGDIPLTLTLHDESTDHIFADFRHESGGTESSVGRIKYDSTNDNLDFTNIGVDIDDNLTVNSLTLDNAGAGNNPVIDSNSGNKALRVSEAVTFTPLSTAPSHEETLVYYDDSVKALSYYNDESGVTMNIGQEQYVRVRNQTGSTISDGDVVFINGTHGNTGLPTVALAKADSSTTADVAGVATHTIESSSSGYITTFGTVRNLDTSAFSAGDTVYLSATTAGELTTTPPGAPNFSVKVGVIEKSGASSGMLLVTPGDRREPIYTSGSIPFASSTGVLVEDSANLSWDNTNNVLNVASIDASGSTDWTNTTSQTASGTNGSYTTTGERYIFVDTATNSTAYTVTLASADATLGRTIEIKDSGGGAGTNGITINTESTETIDGGSSTSISSNFGSVTVVWNGSEWSIV